MKRLGQAIVALVMLLLGRRRHRDEDADRIIPSGESNPRAELAVAVLLFATALSAAGFIVVYSLGKFGGQHELLGITLGLAFAFLSVAMIVLGKGVIVSEELEEEYPEVETPQEQAAVAEIMEESATTITRKGLLATAGGAAASALGLAALTPALSFGPWFNLKPMYRTPWKRGRRVVDDHGTPFKASDIEPETFYTGFAEGASKRDLGSPVVIVRVDPAELRLPRRRAKWAPQSIVAFSKICPHAGCAISLYRKPTFPEVQPRPALVCPCHYSTFDPAKGGELIFGPAGRALPQLPLTVDSAGELRAQGDFSDGIGPGWWGVRMRQTQ